MANRKIFIAKDASPESSVEVEFIGLISEGLYIEITSTDGTLIKYKSISDSAPVFPYDDSVIEFNNGDAETAIENETDKCLENLVAAINSGHSGKILAEKEAWDSNSGSAKLKLTSVLDSNGGGGENGGVIGWSAGDWSAITTTNPTSLGGSYEDWIQVAKNLLPSIDESGDILFSKKVEGPEPSTANSLATKNYVDTVNGIFQNLTDNLWQTGQDLHGRVLTNEGAVSTLGDDLWQTGQDLHGRVLTNEGAVSTLGDDLWQTGQDLHGRVLTNEGAVSTLGDDLWQTGQDLHGRVLTNEGAVSSLGDNLWTTGQTLSTEDLAIREDLFQTGQALSTGPYDFSDSTVELGRPLRIKADSNNDGEVIKFYEKHLVNGDENYFALQTDYSEDIEDGISKILYLSSHGDSWTPKSDDPAHPIISFNAQGKVGIGIRNPLHNLHVNGDVNATNFVHMSDERYKKDISKIDNALQKVQGIDGVNFKWNETSYPYNTPEGDQVGFIAQQIEEVCPELVTDDAEGYKSVSYDKVIPIL
ncbi:MAG: hypothetical protein CL512_04025, partial [Actinobacteria bacterium]|nr:hypothetical protein [Actinomycetota bacterium]